MEYRVHKFNTIEEAEMVIEAINNGEGIPINNNAMTTTYTTYFEYDSFYYIHADNVTEKYIDEVVVLEINIETNEQEIL